MKSSKAERDYVGMAAVIKAFGESFLEVYGRHLTEVQLQALEDLRVCGSEELGGSVFCCSYCGHHAFAYHSCCNRSCPRCSGQHTAKWMAARSKELLPVSYFQSVFTVPAELRAAVKAHPELLGVLMKASARALKELVREKYGVEIGVMAVLHTWNRQLKYHPHSHCVATNGGVTEDGDWKPLDLETDGFSQLLRKRFRSTFIEMAEAAVPGLHVPRSAVTRDWYVHVGDARGETQRILAYLGRYVYRTALSDRRVLAIVGDKVRIQYTPNGSQTPQVVELTGHEFLRRFLQHIPAKGFHRVRYYGLWSPARRKKLRELQKQLPPQSPESTTSEAVDPDGWKRCPVCRTGVMELVFDFVFGFDAERYVSEQNAALFERPPPLAVAA